MDSYDGTGDLKLSNITKKIDWANTSNLISQEGFYLFGGKTQDNYASNKFLIFKIEEVNK